MSLLMAFVAGCAWTAFALGDSYPVEKQAVIFFAAVAATAGANILAFGGH